jgi:hypothetical protein
MKGSTLRESPGSKESARHNPLHVSLFRVAARSAACDFPLITGSRRVGDSYAREPFPALHP